MSEVDADHLGEAVPLSDRLGWWKPLAIWSGFIIVVGIMAVGGGLASQLDEKTFLTTVLFGNLVLALAAGLSGWVGASTGLSFSALTEMGFPGASSRVVQLYVPIVLIGWFGVEAAIFGNIIGEVWEIENRWWLMSGATLIFATTTYLGIRVIGNTSLFLVPAIIVLATYAVVQSIEVTSGYKFASSNEISVNAAIGIVVSSWVMGCLTCVPDITRFAKSTWTGASVAAGGVFFANTFTFMVGGYAAASIGEHDPAKVLIAISTIPLAILFALANIWTTNDNNMYSAALNVARSFHVTRKQAVIICAILAAIFAAINPTKIEHLFTFLGLMGSTAPALGGVIYTQLLMKELRFKTSISWVSWIAGSCAAFFTEGLIGIVLGAFTASLFVVSLTLLMSKRTN